ncbi:hypothetical protein FXF65_25260 [Actinomadura syzygii]|uniref:Uncharacterized protein n=1 Tax=Actinomadura syzygii TaxID=1427538 RepID=A0A5D0U3F3_9ACTN|nr:hypothetical protein FXF65_25260 [Actinomadura syzygii]
MSRRAAPSAAPRTLAAAVPAASIMPVPPYGFSAPSFKHGDVPATGSALRMSAGGGWTVGKHNKPATRACPGCNGTGTSTATGDKCPVCRGTGRI